MATVPTTMPAASCSAALVKMLRNSWPASAPIAARMPAVRERLLNAARKKTLELTHGNYPAPLRLLDSVPGLERVPLKDADECCGGAGIYGGAGGGQVLFAGTPEDLAEQDTPTARFIREELERSAREETVTSRNAPMDLDEMASDEAEDEVEDEEPEEEGEAVA